MSYPTLEDHFRGLWNRARNCPSLVNLSPELIQKWASERGLTVDHLEERDIGTFVTTKSIVLTVNGQQAGFPKIPPEGDANWQLHRQFADRDAALWDKLEWFSPLWVPMGQTRELLKAVENCSKEGALQLFNYHTSTIYTLAFQAVCIAQIMPRARSLREIVPLAREAYLAFYSGYRASSISALIPALEGALTRIVSQGGGEPTIAEKIDQAIDRAIECAARQHFYRTWVPQEYLTLEYLYPLDERVFTFESFRRWLKTSFFQNTTQYDGTTWLNRHLFAHGVSSDWQQSSNFTRLIVALATMGVIEAWHDESNSVSLFFPEMNEDSKLLWQQALFQGQAQATLKMIEQKTYHEHGRLVPDMPTDNGALLRKAILEKDCIDDLVRPLRNAGWQVNIVEPDDEALYMLVTASDSDRTFRVALLYSCATENVIYCELASKCEAILYRGAPYNQDGYAYGITVHVGPVTGWQPPKPVCVRNSM